MNLRSSQNDRDTIPLRAAIELYRAEDASVSNSYDWYRKHAAADGQVSIGTTRVPATKGPKGWMVDCADLDRAVQAHRRGVAHTKQVTTDYEAGILYGDADGPAVRTTWGGYQRRQGFHFVWSTYEVKRMKSNGHWVCDGCSTPAKVEHDREECHVCENWGSCGRDCTASLVLCRTCGTTLVP